MWHRRRSGPQCSKGCLGIFLPSHKESQRAGSGGGAVDGNSLISPQWRWCADLPSEHNTLKQCWLNVGPPSVLMCRVCWGSALRVVHQLAKTQRLPGRPDGTGWWDQRPGWYMDLIRSGPGSSRRHLTPGHTVWLPVAEWRVNAGAASSILPRHSPVIREEVCSFSIRRRLWTAGAPEDTTQKMI